MCNATFANLHLQRRLHCFQSSLVPLRRLIEVDAQCVFQTFLLAIFVQELEAEAHSLDGRCVN